MHGHSEEQVARQFGAVVQHDHPWETGLVSARVTAAEETVLPSTRP